MKPIRHLIAIVFLLCGLAAQGSAREYDRDDMVGTYKCEIQEYTLVVDNDTYRRFGKWEVQEDLVVLHFDELEADSLHVRQVHELDRYVAKELEIIDKHTLFWGYHLQDGYEKRMELQRCGTSGSSSKRKGKNEVWKDLIEQVVQEVVG